MAENQGLADAKWYVTAKYAGLSDYTSRIIYLDESGLEHIYDGHRYDFRDKANVATKEKISNFIERNMVSEKLYSANTVVQGRIKAIYEVNYNTFLHVIIGSDGYIITSYPDYNPS